MADNSWFYKYLVELADPPTFDPKVIAIRIAWAREHLAKKEDDGLFAQAILDHYTDHLGPVKTF